MLSSQAKKQQVKFELSRDPKDKGCSVLAICNCTQIDESPHSLNLANGQETRNSNTRADIIAADSVMGHQAPCVSQRASIIR